MRKVWFAILLIGFTFMQSCSLSDFESGTSKSMQEDFDKIRLDHILIISGLVNEYKDKKGHFPFANRSDSKPIVVLIASEEQIKNDKDRVRFFVDLNSRATGVNIPKQPQSIETLSLQEFKHELEEGLQRQITLPVDPQKVPVNKSSVYFYTYYLDVFDVTAFLHNTFPFARPLSEFNNKITVGYRSSPSTAVWTPDDLMKKESFRRFFKSPFNKGGYTIKTAIK